MIFTKPEELVEWTKLNDSHIDIDREGAEILLDYMEGHDYRLGSNADGELYRLDICTEQEEVEEYSLDDAIDVVCEWNYEFIKENEARKEHSEDWSCKDEEELKRLKYQEEKLDILFDQTIYLAEIEIFAKQLVSEFIESLNKDSIDVAVEELGDKIRSGVGDRNR